MSSDRNPGRGSDRWDVEEGGGRGSSGYGGNGTKIVAVADNHKKDETTWYERKLACHWNFTCKALVLGLTLMLIGGSMATVGYFVEHMYVSAGKKDEENGEFPKEKGKVNINSISTYLGPMIMGVGGFIVVAACVMTFEQRDNAAKSKPNRLRIVREKSLRQCKGTGGGGGGGGSSPNRNFSIRESFRRYQQQQEFYCGLEGGRRVTTADFIHFSRNLHQSGRRGSKTTALGVPRCPSAPNLSESVDGVDVSPGSRKCSRNSLHPITAGNSPLPRQSLSVDIPPDAYPRSSPPRSPRTRSGRQVSSSPSKGSGDSIAAVGRDREPVHRSDTARKHVLMRQCPVLEGEEEGKCYSPRRAKFISSSQPHSRRDSYSPKTSFEHDGRNYGSYAGTSPLRRTYVRANTIGEATRGDFRSGSLRCRPPGSIEMTCKVHRGGRRRCSVSPVPKKLPEGGEAAKCCESRQSSGDSKKSRGSPEESAACPSPSP